MDMASRAECSPAGASHTAQVVTMWETKTKKEIILSSKYIKEQYCPNLWKSNFRSSIAGRL